MMTKGDQLAEIVKLIDQNSINYYARASGDYNPIHIDEKYAAISSPFESTIAHGMMIAATISEMMNMDFKDDWASNGKLKLKFRTPVLSGDTITTIGNVKDISERSCGYEIICSVGVRRHTGEIAISGEARVSTKGS